MKGIFILLSSFLFSLSILAQSGSCVLSGSVSDKDTGHFIEGAAVSVLGSSIGTITDNAGHFYFCHLDKQEYTLIVEFIGYKNDTISVDLIGNNTSVLDVKLIPYDITLKEVIVDAKTQSVVATKYVRGDILDNPDSTFPKLLSIIPGATTMNIGASIAKPVIRGLGFNRVAVVSRGIVQQNQQWGADHGMEVNQYDIYTATVHKGANSLLLGSGATTAIDIQPYGFENRKDSFLGEAILFGATNNDQWGGALTAKWQKDKWFLRGTFSYKDYADYRVPANHFIYEGEKHVLPDKRVPNTAGKENSISGTIGFRERNITSYINISNNYQKNGLFELPHNHEEHDHGEENHAHDHDHDIIETSHRNINMPYSTSNHFAVTNNTEWKTSSLRLLINTGYQNNHRREFESFHENYEGQPEPDANDNLAVDFKLQTYSTNARLYLDEKEKWKKIIGMSLEYQQNRVGGYEFFLPRYNQVAGGLSFINSFEASEKVLLQAGLRYDLAHTNITGFYDNALASHLQDEGYDSQIIQQYAQRAYDVNRNFGNWSASVGTKYIFGQSMYLQASVGKTFRFPSANELGTNGVHHAAFRYEIGNPDLKSENGYTFDIDYYFNNDDRIVVNFSPFINYYTNFIFLDRVTDSPVDLYEEQPYRYNQAKAVFGGGEYKVSWQMVADRLELSSGGSFVINKNLDDHNPLPFTPPFSMKNEIKFFNNLRNKTGLTYYQFSASHQLYAKQSRAGVGEEKTQGSNLFGLGAGFDYKFNNKWSVLFNIQAHNIFNKYYLNHMSLYRRLNIPEQGRNIQVFIRIPFNS